MTLSLTLSLTVSLTVSLAVSFTVSLTVSLSRVCRGLYRHMVVAWTHVAGDVGFFGLPHDTLGLPHPNTRHSGKPFPIFHPRGLSPTEIQNRAQPLPGSSCAAVGTARSDYPLPPGRQSAIGPTSNDLSARLSPVGPGLASGHQEIMLFLRFRIGLRTCVNRTGKVRTE